MVNLKNVLNLIYDEFSPMFGEESVITVQEQNIAGEICQILYSINDKLQTGEQPYEIIHELYIDDEATDEAMDEDLCMEENNDNREQRIDFAYRQKAVAYWKSKSGGHIRYSTVQNKFKRLRK